MKATRSHDDYGPHELPGWIQTGNVDGRKYGTWFKAVESIPSGLSITLGEKSGRYWLRVGNCYRGCYKTPEKAAAVAELILVESEE